VKAVHRSILLFPFYNWEEAQEDCGFAPYPWAGKMPLEEGVGTHSSIPAWRIPWTEEPGGLQSVGS